MTVLILEESLFRFRKSRLPLPAVGLLIFAIVMGAALIWQLFIFVTEPGGVDWLLVGLFIATIALFVAMGLAVFFLDFEQRLVLLREGIYVMPSVFAAYKINWDDIERLEMREGHGFRVIAYRLKPDSPSYTASIKRDGKRHFLATEGRNDGFHGAIPIQAFQMEVTTASTEQDNVRANRLFPILYRFWTNPAARNELPEQEGVVEVRG